MGRRGVFREAAEQGGERTLHSDEGSAEGIHSSVSRAGERSGGDGDADAEQGGIGVGIGIGIGVFRVFGVFGLFGLFVFG